MGYAYSNLLHMYKTGVPMGQERKCRRNMGNASAVIHHFNSISSFSLYVTVLSGIAVGVMKLHLDKDILMWFEESTVNEQMNTIYYIPIVMLMQDSVNTFFYTLLHCTCIIMST